MNAEQMQQKDEPSQEPGDIDCENPVGDPCKLCALAMGFIWDVSKEVEKEVAKIGQPGNDDKLSKKIIRQMVRDIRRQVKDNCPKEDRGHGDEGPRDRVLCSSCLPTYNLCMSKPGANPSVCMSAYSTCCGGCS